VLNEGESTEVTISTVWLGMDMSFSFLQEPHIPLIFETMIFLAPDPNADRVFGESVYQTRYPTEESALAGHDQAVAWAKQTLFFQDKENEESGN
jgi:hypothetical protein